MFTVLFATELLNTFFVLISICLPCCLYQSNGYNEQALELLTSGHRLDDPYLIKLLYDLRKDQLDSLKELKFAVKGAMFLVGLPVIFFIFEC